MTAEQLFTIRARHHQADAELLQALQATLDELKKITEQRNQLAAEVEKLKAPKEKE